MKTQAQTAHHNNSVEGLPHVYIPVDDIGFYYFEDGTQLGLKVETGELWLHVPGSETLGYKDHYQKEVHMKSC